MRYYDTEEDKNFSFINERYTDSYNSHATYIIEALDDLRRNNEKVHHSQLRRVVINQERMSKRTFNKTITRMVEKKELIKINDPNNQKVFYDIPTTLFKASDEYQLSLTVDEMKKELKLLEKIYPKLDLRNKVTGVIHFYQTLLHLRTQNELSHIIQSKQKALSLGENSNLQNYIRIKDGVIKDDGYSTKDKVKIYTKRPYLIPRWFRSKHYKPIQNGLNELIDYLFGIVSNDTDGKTVNHLIVMNTLGHPTMTIDELIKTHNKDVRKLEKNAKNTTSIDRR